MSVLDCFEKSPFAGGAGISCAEFYALAIQERVTALLGGRPKCLAWRPIKAADFFVFSGRLVYYLNCIKSWVDAHANLPLPGKVEADKAM